MGRTRLMEAMGNSFTEYEVRTMLEYLTGEGCLLPRRGRGGTALSPEEATDRPGIFKFRQNG